MAQCYGRDFVRWTVIGGRCLENSETFSSFWKRILTSETKEAFEFKLMKWLNITDFLRGAIRTTTKHHWPNVPRWGHGASFWHVEAIWILISRQQIYRASASKSSCAYQLKPYPILMALHSMRRIPWNETRSDSKKLVLPICLTGCTPPGFLNGLSSEYEWCLQTIEKAAQAKRDKDAKHEPDLDSILEQI